MLSNYKFKTEFNDVFDIREFVFDAVEKSKVKSGTCIVYTPHTTAGITVTSFWDPKGFEDLQDEICRLIPTRVDFKHQHDTPFDAAGHVKSSLLGVSMSFIIADGKLLLGHSQGIYFLDFDGPRNREIFVKIQADN